MPGVAVPDDQGPGVCLNGNGFNRRILSQEVAFFGQWIARLQMTPGTMATGPLPFL